MKGVLRIRSVGIACLLMLAALSVVAEAQLVITEIQSSQSTGTGKNDYWELTNFGPSTVALGGYKWDDDSRNPADAGAATVPAGTNIAPGESIIFSLNSAANFRTWWGIPATVQVISSNNPGLGMNDAVALFNASGAEVTYISYAAAGFTKSDGAAASGDHAGLSAGGSVATQAMILDPTFGITSPRYTAATGSNFGTFQAATGVDKGSPGTADLTLPTVDFTATPLTVRFGQEVTFTATTGNTLGSVNYAWNFGDGESTSVKTASVVHRYVHGGTFSPTFTITADNGSALKTRTSYITVGTFGADGDQNGFKDGFDVFFNLGNPADRSHLPHLTGDFATGYQLQFSKLAGLTGMNGVLQSSSDLTTWNTAAQGLDYDTIFSNSSGGNVVSSYVLAGLGIPAAGMQSDTSIPRLQFVAGASLGGTRIVNQGLVGVGRVSGASVDQFGETLGASSSLAVTNWAYNATNGSFTGTFQMLPDRGYNTGTSFSNYAARVHSLNFTFTPYYGTAPVAQNQFSISYQQSRKFTYLDGATTKFTTGLNPTGTATVFGQPLGVVTAANGPGGSQQPLLSIDAESLALMPDGSGFFGDEYGCYLSRFDANGKITGITRLPEAALPHRPASTLNYDADNTPSNGRRDNQGLEAISISPDQTRLFALTQSALVQDSVNGQHQMRCHARLFVFNIAGALIDSPQLIGEYVVKLPRITENGDGNSLDRTAAQSEVIALNNRQFLMLPRDGSGLGSGATTPSVYKAVQLVDFSRATNILGTYDTLGAAVSPSGVLNSGVKAAAAKDVVNLLATTDHTRFGINTNNAAPDGFTMPEKIEGMAIVPDLSTAATDDYFLFVANDNDFQSPAVMMLNSSGVLQNYGDGRTNAGNGKVTNDAVFFAYRLTIGDAAKRFFRMQVSGD